MTSYHDELEKTRPVFFNSRKQFAVKCPYCDDVHRHGTGYGMLNDGFTYAGPRQSDCFDGGQYRVVEHPGLPSGEKLKLLLDWYFSKHNGKRHAVGDLVEFHQSTNYKEVLV